MKKLSPKYFGDFKHPLVTRRDFLSHGLLAFSAISAAPTFLGGSNAWAAAAGMCGGATGGSTALPFLAFDMAGGASLPGNFLVGKRGGAEDLLSSYGTLGWNPRESGALNKDFGLPMSAKYSKLLAGIMQTASAGARANLRMGSFCHTAQFDSSSNELNAGTLVLKSGTRGTYITNGTGSEDSVTGGNSSGPQQSATFKPTFVRSVGDLLSSTNFGGASFTGIDVAKIKSLAQGAVELGEVQKEAFMGMAGGKTLADGSVCAYSKSLDFLAGVQGLDPRQDGIAAGVYGINAGSAPDDMNVVAASVVMNSVNGFAGPGTWSLGGCDYHTGDQATGDGKDLEMGLQMGKAIELAFQMKKPLFFQLITDGGNSAQEGTRNWSADSGERTMTVIGFFDPKGPPEMIRSQVGQFTDGQGADPASVIGGNPTLVAYAAFANYLSVTGRLGEFSTYAPGVFTGTDELKKVLIFAERKG